MALEDKFENVLGREFQMEWDSVSRNNKCEKLSPVLPVVNFDCGLLWCFFSARMNYEI